MNIGISIAGNVDFDLHDFTIKNNIDLWIAVDGGYDHLIRQSIECETLIGDLDSINNEISPGVDVIKLNTVKAETDFEMAINYVFDNYDDPKIYVIGIVGNDRFEHFYANLLMLRENVELHTKNTIFKLVQTKQPYVVEKKLNYEFISFFAKEEVIDLSIKGAKYELIDYCLIPSDVRCISNEFVDGNIVVTFKSGSLMIVVSGDHYRKMTI